MGFSPICVVSANTTSISEAEPQFYCPTTSGYGQETGKFSPTKTGKLSPTVTPLLAVSLVAYQFEGRGKTKVLYTAHGFHFYKGSSFLSWLIYFPIEKILATRTDCIVTINEEDFLLAKKHFHTNVKKIDGVGVDLSRFVPITENARVTIRHI